MAWDGVIALYHVLLIDWVKHAALCVQWHAGGTRRGSARANAGPPGQPGAHQGHARFRVCCGRRNVGGKPTPEDCTSANF